jgi:hypothetical protein
MKKVYILLLLVTAFACKKEANQGNEELIVGKWELRESVGGIAGQLKYDAGNGIIMEFRYNGTYTFYLSAANPTQTGTYVLQPTSTTGQYLLYLAGTVSHTYTIKLFTDKLVRLPESDCCDMPTDTFVKL